MQTQGIVFTIVVAPAEPEDLTGDAMQTLAGDFVNAVQASGYTIVHASMTTGTQETLPPA